jgi:exopolysaccharide biosynthesis WecB/TagA/CpsF family protein
LPGKAISATIPGKFSTYLKANKYILGFIEGETKELINRLSVGESISPDDPLALSKKIIFLQKKFYKKKIIIKKNKVLKKFLENDFNKNLILANFNEFISSIFDSYLKFKLITNPLNIPYKKNFSLSGLNLAFIGYLSQGKIKLRKYILLWPDGIFHKRFYNIKSKKISGRALIQAMILPKFIKNIYVLGNLSGVAKKYLQNNFKKNVIHISLPYGSPEYIFKSVKTSFYEEDIILITLPTPTQELVSELIVKKNKHYKIICLGGALEMASGNDMPVPTFLENLGLEFIWRLRSETTRRLKRLIITFIYYVNGELSFKYKSIRMTVFD